MRLVNQPTTTVFSELRGLVQFLFIGIIALSGCCGFILRSIISVLLGQQKLVVDGDGVGSEEEQLGGDSR